MKHKIIYQLQSSQNTRQIRVSKLLHHTIALLLNRGEVFHPILERFSLTVLDVKTSIDLKSSTIFVSPINKQIDKKIIEILNTLVPEYRKRLSKRIKLKSLPKIRFKFDEHVNEKMHLDRLLDKNL